MASRDPKLILLTALAGLISALIMIFGSYPIARYGLVFLPGATFGAILSCCELLPLDLQAELHLRFDRTAIAYRKWLAKIGLKYGTS